jgi:hypothetical protein
LFDLAENPLCSVAERQHLGWVEEGEALKWRRKLFAWEGDLLRNCCFLLHNIVLHDGVLDCWKWLLDPIKGFSVSDVYHMFTTSDHNTEQVNTINVWLKHVPLKVYLFVWRLFRNHLPTKDNLITRGIIQAEANVCVGGCGVQESTYHLFITCSHYGQLWMQIRS